MRLFSIILIIFFHPSKTHSEQLSCRTNCSNNGTADEQCWREALTYRSSELVDQLFSFGSLSVYVNSFKYHHENEINNTIEFLDQSLENHLINESNDAHLNKSLFTEAKDLLLQLCQNLTTTQVKTVREFPSLSCSTTTCVSDIFNYMVLFIISIILSSLILLICAIQLFQTRRKTTSLVPVQQNAPFLQNSHSTTNTSVIA
jgi:hypothetical protein